MYHSALNQSKQQSLIQAAIAKLTNTTQQQKMAIRMSKIFTKIPHFQQRSMSVVATSLRYTEYGEPKDVIKCVEEKLDAPSDTQVLVKMLAAPINPADINTIQGFLFV